MRKRRSIRQTGIPLHPRNQLGLVAGVCRSGRYVATISEGNGSWWRRCAVDGLEFDLIGTPTSVNGFPFGGRGALESGERGSGRVC